MRNDLMQTARQFSANFPVMDDVALRRKRGLKIAAVLREFSGENPPGVLLDVGCSNAIVLDTLVEALQPRYAVGIDMDSAVAPPPTPERGIVVGDAMTLPFAPGSIDVIVCNHTYEHVPDAEQMFSEFQRVLSPKGCIYFSAMNARWPIEPHYKLPFVHWLPARWASRLLRRYRGVDSYLERPRTTAGLRQLVASFDVTDYTLRVIRNAKQYHADDLVRVPWLGSVYVWIARVCYPFIPGYLWVLTKRS